ncbi:MAG: hypothetical protein WA705_05115 [Candidatus Ozemobacteraceae bacterium]
MSDSTHTLVDPATVFEKQKVLKIVLKTFQQERHIKPIQKGVGQLLYGYVDVGHLFIRYDVIPSTLSAFPRVHLVFSIKDPKIR